MISSFSRRFFHEFTIDKSPADIILRPFAEEIPRIQAEKPPLGEGGKVRTWTSLAACACIAALASPALAQTAKGFGGISPTSVVSQPISTTGSTGSGIPLFDHSIHLKDFVPSVGAFSNKTVVGQSNYPSAENMPGLNYLKAFGFSQSQTQPPPASSSTKKKKRFPAWLYSRPYASN